MVSFLLAQERAFEVARRRHCPPFNGRASFAAGSRYGEWAACLFALEPESPPAGYEAGFTFPVLLHERPRRCGLIQRGLP